MPYGWAAAAAAVGTLGSASIQSNASKSAASAQQKGQLLGLKSASGSSNEANRRLRPFRDTGYEANSALNYFMGFGNPEEMARTEDNFDADAYRNYLVGVAEDKSRDRFASNPIKREKFMKKRIAEIDKNIEAGGAWKHFKSRESEGRNVDGDFWKKRTVVPSGAGSDPNFGFLTKRFNNDVFEKDPGYQFRMDEGARAVEGSAAARGGLLSGAAAKAMQKYGQGFASNEYGNAYNRFSADQSNLYGRLTGLQDTGARAAGVQGANVMAAGQQAIRASNDWGDSRAAGIMGSANARASGYSKLANTGQDLAMLGLAENKGWM